LISDGIIECEDESKDSASEFQMNISFTSDDNLNNFVEKHQTGKDMIKDVCLNYDYFKFQDEDRSMVKVCPMQLKKEYESYFDDMILK
jgi:hypothetical protein